MMQINHPSNLDGTQSQAKRFEHGKAFGKVPYFSHTYEKQH
jgi:hypothetical protein